MSQLGPPPYPLIRDGLFQGRVIPFLGSGASLGGRASGAAWVKDRATFLPTAAELARHLAQMTRFPADEPPNLTAELAAYFVPDLAKVAQYYSVVGGRDTLQRELHNIFNRDYSLTPLHALLADITMPLLIVTTNYDDLIERAFNARGRPYDLVIHTTDPTFGYQLLWWEHGAREPGKVNANKLDIDLQAVTVIYKMHGAVDRRQPTRDQYVITEDDYIDFLARMTKNKAIPSIFAEPFQTRHFLFLGYGLYDWNLRVVLNRIEKDLRRRKGITSWAIQYKPKPLEQRFWLERGVDVYNMTIEEFIKELTSC
jgi:SIR2-like domain